jgi:small GTP-binding protein
MGFKCGIVGFPNVGKSSLFNKLTGKQQAEVANYPFCTIEPNVAMVPVKDPRLENLSKKTKSEKIIYSLTEFVDIAGLVKNASNGEGLGNRFLSHISEVDLIIHVVRTFIDDDITHIMDRINPLEDLEIIQLELLLSDLNKIIKAKTNEKKLSPELKKALDEAEKCLLAQQPIIGYYNELKPYNLLSMKPFMVLMNGSLDPKLVDYCNSKSIDYYNLDVKNTEEKEIDTFIMKAYTTLGLIDFFTTGPKETRAWTIQTNTKAIDAAGAIHSDFIKKFIRAEVTHYDDYMNNKKFNLEGKDYIVQSADIINFRIGS